MEMQTGLETVSYFLAEQCTLQVWYHKERLPDSAKAFSSAACFLWTVGFFSPPDFSVCYIATDWTNLDYFLQVQLSYTGECRRHWAMAQNNMWSLEIIPHLFFICLTTASFTLPKDFRNRIFFKSCAEAVPLQLNDIRIFNEKKRQKQKEPVGFYEWYLIY